MSEIINNTVSFIRKAFGSEEDFIPLHVPYFGGNEKKYLNETIDSTFVSSVGAFVNRFEEELAQYTGAKFAVACVNGTNALHMALLVCGVEREDEVLSQSLTFIATANAISYIGAKPVFIDVDKETMGLSPRALQDFLEHFGELKADGFTYNTSTGKRIAACIPMHTFGFPARIDEIEAICTKWNIALIEDAAESLGSYYKGKHTGVFGKVGVFSFNGNKTITCGGGGALITDDEELAKKAKHLTTQAKIPHQWKFRHDDIGYNYRMPNLNAALACAQLEQLDEILENKRALALKYKAFFADSPIRFFSEQPDSKANYWLNAIILPNEEERDVFLRTTNEKGVMTRPIWDLISSLPMFENCQNDGLENSKWFEQRVVNIPSSYRSNDMDSEKKNIVLVGGGGHCKSCIDVIESTGKYNIVGVLDLPSELGKKVLNYEVIGTDDDYVKFRDLNCVFLITAGQIESFGVRKKIFQALNEINAPIETIISTSATVSMHSKVGKGSIIMHHCIVNAGADIGENCIINNASIIEHDVEIGNHTHISTNAVINGDCMIGNETFIGSGSCVRNGVQIRDEIVIGAGSLVISDVSESGIYVGTPVHKIR